MLVTTGSLFHIIIRAMLIPMMAIITVSKQKGTKDCGLFSLGYSLALSMDIDNGKLVFGQNKLRSEFSEIIKNQNLYLYLFSHAVIENYNPKFTSICVH
ncbi:hypothetical protein BpHYR1_025801 [Brachionus plicatilis]|uniref:Uncharacterized protein n=1 Tax=Brachionus plicatilis TaxID=10195 RepID=A0A3M7PI75_BRAPC|nr:hypothetical protein BpHYR1_025801 [Brachionus plicatilis]